MDRGAWRATPHGVKKSQTRLSDWACMCWVSHLSSSVLLGLSSTLSDPQILPHQKGVPQRVCVQSVQFSSVQSFSHVQFFVTPWTVVQLGLNIFLLKYSWLTALCWSLLYTAKWLSYTHRYIFPQQGLLISNFLWLRSPPQRGEEKRGGWE